MDVLGSIAAPAIYSAFASKGVRPDARGPQQSRVLALIPDAVSIASGCSCVGRLGTTSVVASAKLDGADTRLRVHVPAVAAAGTGGSSRGGVLSSVGPLGEAAALLERQLSPLYCDGAVTVAEADSGSTSGGRPLGVTMDVLVLADDGGLIDIATAAMTVALSRLCARGTVLTADGRQARVELSRRPVACTVAAVRYGEGQGQAWQVEDPATSAGEGLPAHTISLSHASAQGSSGAGAFSGSSGPTAVAAGPARGGAAGTGLAAAGLATAHICAVVDSSHAADPDSCRVLSLSCTPGQGGPSSSSPATVPASVMDEAVRAAVRRARVVMDSGR